MRTGPGEFDIIREYFAVAAHGEGVLLGIGDDCALLQPPASGVLATSVDTLVAGRHFPVDAHPALLASRALRVNLSDLAAMNARPLWFTLALTLPDSDAQWLQDFSSGLLETAAEFGVSLVGGDTTRGPLSITIQVTGVSEAPLRRDGARPGDGVYVSGPLGAAAAALPVVLGELAVDPQTRARAERAFYRPHPQLALARALGGLATSGLDISDGLLADLGHICAASGVGAELDMAAVPVAPLAIELNAGDALAQAAAGGDDYQLCFTLPAGAEAQMRDVCHHLDLEPVKIGRITAAVPGETGDKRVRCQLEGAPWTPPGRGYTHF